ncbi:MAG: hypothetical protein ABW352_00685 [Polyangiales bacterium]
MDLRQREIEAVWGFLRAHREELQLVAAAIASGKVADVAGAVARAYVTYRTGFPPGGVVAEGVVKRCAQAVGAWFASRHDAEAEARRYALADLHAKFAFAQLMKERFDAALASVEVTLAQRQVIDAPLRARLCIRHQDLHQALAQCLATYNDLQLRTALLPPVAQHAYVRRMQEQQRIKAQLQARVADERKRERRHVVFHEDYARVLHQTLGGREPVRAAL